MSARIPCTFVICILAIHSSLFADPLYLELLPTPDVVSSFIDVDYVAATDSFTASGFAMEFENDGVPPADAAIDSGSFLITATVDDAGVPSGGTLDIGGTFTYGPDSFGPNLLSGTLTALGFDQNGLTDLFEFLFTITGGDLATPDFFGLPGSTVGVIMNANGSTFTGSWASDFNNNFGIPGFGFGSSDAAPPIPEPTSAGLLAMGLGVLLLRRSPRSAARRQRSRTERHEEIC